MTCIFGNALFFFFSQQESSEERQLSSQHTIGACVENSLSGLVKYSYNRDGMTLGHFITMQPQ